jgi:type IV secretion system protein VirD4
MRRYDRYPGWYGYGGRGPGGGRLASFAALVGTALVTLALLLRAAGPAVPGNGIWPQLALASVGALLGALVARRAGSASATTVQVWSRRYRRNSGVASFWVLLWKASRWAMLRRSHVWRLPGRRALVAPLAHPASSYAVRMARVGTLSVYSPIEDVNLPVGGPRTGKSGEIADHIADAPGAVIATSTRLDLLETDGPLRSRQGPVGIFNPSGLGGIASTVHFDPIVGCQHPSTAYARAEDMLGTVGLVYRFSLGRALRVHPAHDRTCGRHHSLVLQL